MKIEFQCLQTEFLRLFHKMYSKSGKNLKSFQIFAQLG